LAGDETALQQKWMRERAPLQLSFVGI